MSARNKVPLSAMFGNYPNTKALKNGTIWSDLVAFDFVEVEVANNLFKSVVRDADYDVSELAIVTYLQAKAYGKPYVLLPAVLVSRGQHHTIAYNGERGKLDRGDLRGNHVGVRTYSVTTGAWVRGILANDYGVDLNSIEWVTFEEPHLAEYCDPPIVKRAPPGKRPHVDRCRRRQIFAVLPRQFDYEHTDSMCVRAVRMSKQMIKAKRICTTLNCSVSTRERVLRASAMRLPGTEFLGPETGAVKASIPHDGRSQRPACDEIPRLTL